MYLLLVYFRIVRVIRITETVLFPIFIIYTMAHSLLINSMRPIHEKLHASLFILYDKWLILIEYFFIYSRDTRGRKALIPIAETHPSGNCQVPPYQVQKALVEDKLVPCINLKPFVYQELLMTLPDFVQQYFPASDISSCRQVLTDVLGIDLYQGNRWDIFFILLLLFFLEVLVLFKC